MALPLWVVTFLAVTLVDAWIVCLGGAEFFDDRDWLFPGYNLSAEAIRFIVIVQWLMAAAWFVIGLLDPDVRLFDPMIPSG